ncbi:MAG: RNase adaptor protein RapZ, partial [Chromatiales bacterium]|nr:RNase adaptor protein RapZ [Chromatiales bacterium]
MRILIVSGLSGSGKSVALNMLEDLDFYCIDNVPVSLLGSMLSQLIESTDMAYEKLALGIDARNKEADLNALPELFYSLRKNNISADVIYLHADTDVL